MEKKEPLIGPIIGGLFFLFAAILSYLQNPMHPVIAIAIFLMISAIGIFIIKGYYKRIPKRWHGAIAAMLIIFALIIILYACLTNQPLLPPLPPHIEITSPENGSDITMVQSVTGISSGIPAEPQLWVVIYAHKPTNRYYPQREPITPDRNGNWLIKDINVGNAYNSGYKFDIIALLLNESGQKEFDDYFKNVNTAGSGWPGMKQLPAGIIASDNVTVTRK